MVKKASLTVSSANQTDLAQNCVFRADSVAQRNIDSDPCDLSSIPRIRISGMQRFSVKVQMFSSLDPRVQPYLSSIL